MNSALSTTNKCNHSIVGQRLKLSSATLLGMNATHAMIGGTTNTYPGTLTVAENATATAIAITAPTTRRFPITHVTISALPTNGVVTLADGVTPVTVGQDVGVTLLTELKFTPTAGLFSSSSSLSYSVTDGQGGDSSGTETIVIAAPVTPDPPTVAGIASASDTGAAGDLLTSVTHPVITGTGATGDTVSLFDGTNVTPIGTAVVVNGTWSITPAVALGNGLHTLTAKQANSNNVVSAASTGLTLTIDTSVPAAPLSLTLASASDSGVQGDNLTNATLPAITGTGALGDTVILYDSTTVVGTTTITAANGHWSITPTVALTSGLHSLTATQANPAGTVSPASATLALTIDTSVPAAPLSLTLASASDSGVQGDNLTNATLPAITGTGALGDTVILYDSTTAVGTTTITAANGHWSITPTVALTSGLHSLTATQANPAGTVSPASATLALTIDTSVPAAPLSLALAPASDSGVQGDNLTNATLPAITGTGALGDTVTLSDGATVVGTTTITASNGGWSITPTAALANGPHNLTARQANPAGTVSPASATLALTIDTTIPAATSGLTLAPASDSGAVGDGITSTASPVITGAGMAGDTVRIYKDTTLLGSATVAAGGAWSFSTGPLADGTYSLTTTQTSPAGNVSSASAPFALTVDTVAPHVTAALAANPHNTASMVYNQVLSGGGDANASVTIREGSVVVGSTTADATGAWSFDLAGLAAGSHSLIASETDAAGNTGASVAVPVTVAPSVVPDTRFTLATGSAATSGAFFGSDYTGAAGHLQAQYGYVGTANVSVTANVANTFIYGGSGNDAIVAKAGSNVLDGAGGSNWMIGASGADGGTDTFFVDNRTSQTTWNTLLNFHVGDMMTVWDFNPAAGSVTFADNLGQPGYTGLTLEAGLGNSTGATDLATFAGLSSSTAHLVTSTGTSGGLSYLAVTRVA